MGKGHLLKAVLEAVPNTKRILFDLPNVAEVAGLASDRLHLQAGDFFKESIPVCDLYLLIEIIHDWPDDQTIRVLRAIRQKAPDHARLQPIEQLIPEDSGPHWSKIRDIHMLILLGGCQRNL